MPVPYSPVGMPAQIERSWYDWCMAPTPTGGSNVGGSCTPSA